MLSTVTTLAVNTSFELKLAVPVTPSCSPATKPAVMAKVGAAVVFRHLGRLGLLLAVVVTELLVLGQTAQAERLTRAVEVVVAVATTHLPRAETVALVS